MANVPNPKPAKNILPAFTGEEVQRLLSTSPDARARALIFFLLDTGLRAAEVVKLNGSDVDLKSGAVRVIEGKGRKDRMTYLGAKSRRALVGYYAAAGWPQDDGPVWRSERTGERLTDSGLRQLLHDIGAQARVPHCTPHTFRRTFALFSLRGGMNIHVLARLMGHADIQVLRQYLPLVEADLQAAHQAAAPVDRLLK
jgi:site-specific recombinase XerD